MRKRHKFKLSKIIGFVFGALLGMALLGGLVYMIYPKRIMFYHSVSINSQDTKDKKSEFKVALANNDDARKRGLMFVKSMHDENGMFFDFEENDVVCMWMKNTFIGLDIVFINEDMKVVWIECDAIPLNEESLCSIEPVKYALEINSGMVKEYDIQIGDTITFEKDKFKE